MSIKILSSANDKGFPFIQDEIIRKFVKYEDGDYSWMLGSNKPRPKESAPVAVVKAQPLPSSLLNAKTSQADKVGNDVVDFKNDRSDVDYWGHPQVSKPTITGRPTSQPRPLLEVSLSTLNGNLGAGVTAKTNVCSESSETMFLPRLVEVPPKFDPRCAKLMEEIHKDIRRLEEEEAKLVNFLDEVKAKIKEIDRKTVEVAAAASRTTTPPQRQLAEDFDFDPEHFRDLEDFDFDPEHLRDLEEARAYLKYLRTVYEKSSGNSDRETLTSQPQKSKIESVLAGLDEEDEVDMIQKLQELVTQGVLVKFPMHLFSQSTRVHVTRVQIQQSVQTQNANLNKHELFRRFAERIKSTVGFGGTMQDSCDDAWRNVYKKLYGESSAPGGGN